MTFPSAVELRDWHCGWKQRRSFADGEDRGAWPVCPECGRHASVAVDDGSPWPEFLAQNEREQEQLRQLMTMNVRRS